LVFGGAATGNIFAGHFYNSGTNRFSSGVGAGGGVYAGAPDPGGRFGMNLVSAPKAEVAPVFIGATAGVGAGGFITNANNITELAGPFTMRQLNTPIGSVQLDTGSGIFVLSVTGGPKGLGTGSFVQMTTTTATSPAIPTMMRPPGIR
jgi:hypothetical protein